MPHPNAVLALTTCENSTQAESLTKEILEERLAACVTALKGGVSSYWWQGKIEKAEEVVLLIKTTSELIPGLQNLFKRSHPYELPELIAFPVTQGSDRYLAWLVDSVGR